MKGSKRRKAKRPSHKIKKTKILKRVATREESRPISDLEDLLVDALVVGTNKAKSEVIEDIIYNITPSMSTLGYRQGFAIGSHLFSKVSHKNALPDVLEKINFGKIIYVPLDDRLIITSTGTTHTPLNIGINLHTYEAGLIAGYLSNATGVRIDTKEVQCRYNNSHFCQFVSSQQINSNASPNLDTDKLIDALAYAMKSAPAKADEISYQYSMLKLLPLLNAPLVNEIANLLQYAGARLADETSKANAERVIENIASNFGIKSASIRTKKKNRKVLKLRYGQYNSVDGFIVLSVQPFVGYCTKLFNSNASIYKSINQDNSYTVTIELNRIKGGI